MSLSARTPFGGADDPLYDEAVTLVRQARHASLSLLQRHLHIGHHRASYMLEAMVGSVIDKTGPGAKILPVRSTTASMQDFRDRNPAPSHGCGHMQGRGAA